MLCKLLETYLENHDSDDVPPVTLEEIVQLWQGLQDMVKDAIKQ
jgi:hypothetical protein